MKNSKVKIVIIGKTAMNMANKLYGMENVEILKEDYSELLNIKIYLSLKEIQLVFFLFFSIFLIVVSHKF